MEENIMKKALDDFELENVTGGTVVISNTYNAIGFSTSGERYYLQNCTWKQARDFRDELLEANANMSDAKFDAFCKQQFQSRGWLGGAYTK